MRKFVLCLSCCLLCCGFTACAKSAENNIVTIEDTSESTVTTIASDGQASFTQPYAQDAKAVIHEKILPGEHRSILLNNATIEISLAEEKQSQENNQPEETAYILTIRTATGSEASIRSQLFTEDAYVLVTDLDIFDTQYELFFSQVYMGGVQYTTCRGITQDGAYTIPFLDEGSGERNEFFTGLACASKNGCVAMQSDVELIGSRGVRRDHKLINGTICPDSESEFNFSFLYDMKNLAASWSNYGVTVFEKSLPAEIDGKPTTLSTGTKLLLMSMNEQGLVQFMTSAGESGSFLIERTDEGLWTIEGAALENYLTKAS